MLHPCWHWQLAFVRIGVDFHVKNKYDESPVSGIQFWKVLSMKDFRNSHGGNKKDNSLNFIEYSSFYCLHRINRKGFRQNRQLRPDYCPSSRKVVKNCDISTTAVYSLNCLALANVSTASAAVQTKSRFFAHQLYRVQSFTDNLEK